MKYATKTTTTLRLVMAMAVGFATATAAAATFRVEIDFMGDPGDGHDHQPDQIVLDAVIQMFACQGHTLILDLDDQIPHVNTLIGDPTADCSNFWNYTGATNTYRSLRNTWFDREGVDGWHYCIFAHQYATDADPANSGSGCNATNSSGRANGGDAFIVTLGGAPWAGQEGTQFAQAGTLAHELGHNLGLSHCGTANCASNSFDGTATWVGPQVPNMPSVMSYNYQTSGVRTQLIANGLAFDEALFKELDYSHGRMCSWNENNLNETRGTVMMPVDYNCDNDTQDSGVVQDVNYGGGGIGAAAPWCGVGNANLTNVNDYNEWANLSDGAALVANGTRGEAVALATLDARERELDKAPCITGDEVARIEAEMGIRGGGPTLEVETCISGENVYIGPGSPLFDFGICNLPKISVESAQADSPSNSVYFFTPTTYDEANGLLLNKRGKYFCKTGAALIR